MPITLNEIEIRILGSLIEKEYTTPDYYPLTVNSLMAACNQKSNRNPVTAFDETDMEKGLDGLQRKGLVQAIRTPGSRTVKYRHAFLDVFHLIPREAALLCELMLRGRQTLGELRAHADRICSLNDIPEVENTLNDLMDRGEPFVMKLKREPGRKEPRYMHLLSETPEARPENEAPGEEPPDKIAGIEAEVSALRAELLDLKRAFEEFKSRF